MTKYLVKTVLGNVVFSGVTSKDLKSFKHWNRLKTKMQLKYGPSINIEIL